MAQIDLVNSGTTSVSLDLPLLELAAGITLVSANTDGEPFSSEFQLGFPIIEETDFTFETEPFSPVDGNVSSATGKSILGKAIVFSPHYLNTCFPSTCSFSCPYQARLTHTVAKPSAIRTYANTIIGVHRGTRILRSRTGVASKELLPKTSTTCMPEFLHPPGPFVLRQELVPLATEMRLL